MNVKKENLPLMVADPDDKTANEELARLQKAFKTSGWRYIGPDKFSWPSKVWADVIDEEKVARGSKGSRAATLTPDSSIPVVAKDLWLGALIGVIAFITLLILIGNGVAAPSYLVPITMFSPLFLSLIPGKISLERHNKALKSLTVGHKPLVIPMQLCEIWCRLCFDRKLKKYLALTRWNRALDEFFPVIRDCCSLLSHLENPNVSKEARKEVVAKVEVKLTKVLKVMDLGAITKKPDTAAEIADAEVRQHLAIEPDDIGYPGE